MGQGNGIDMFSNVKTGGAIIRSGIEIYTKATNQMVGCPGSAFLWPVASRFRDKQEAEIGILGLPGGFPRKLTKRIRFDDSVKLEL